MEDMGLEVSPDNSEHIELIESADDIRDGEVFPQHFYDPLRLLWNDNGVQQAWDRGNEAAIPEKYNFFFFLSATVTKRRLFKSGILLL
jgi:guanine nucleotide-binding protein subunit alpha